MKEKIAFSLDKELTDRLRKISKETMIPQARLVQKALEKVIEEYEKESAK